MALDSSLDTEQTRNPLKVFREWVFSFGTHWSRDSADIQGGSMAQMLPACAPPAYWSVSESPYPTQPPSTCPWFHCLRKGRLKAFWLTCSSSLVLLWWLSEEDKRSMRLSLFLSPWILEVGLLRKKDWVSYVWIRLLGIPVVGPKLVHTIPLSQKECTLWAGYKNIREEDLWWCPEQTRLPEQQRDGTNLHTTRMTLGPWSRQERTAGKRDSISDTAGCLAPAQGNRGTLSSQPPSQRMPGGPDPEIHSPWIWKNSVHTL